MGTAGKGAWVVPAPAYREVEGWEGAGDDAPGYRCGHSLTFIAPTKGHGPRLILFGGATAIEAGASSGLPGISSVPPPSLAPPRLAGVTNSVHSYDVEKRRWTRMHPAGDPPSPRAAHSAAAVGTMVVFQGGIGPAGHSTDDLYVLDLTNDKFKWHRVVVQGAGPGPRYGHCMDLVAQRYLVSVSGNDGKRVLSDAWALDTAQKPYKWQKLNPEGDRPSARMYATASARSDGMLLLCGGRDASGTPLSDAYGLLMHTNGQWEWTLAPGISPSARYQHAAVFVGARLHVTGGVLKGGRAIEGEGAIAVLDTAAGVWLDRNGIVTSRTLKSSNEHDASSDLLRRCRHAAASVGSQIYIYGGLRGDILLDDFLIAENAPFQSETDRVPSTEKKSIDMLTEASAAEAEAVSAVWRAAKEASAASSEDSLSEGIGSESPLSETSPMADDLDDGGSLEPDVKLHSRAVVVAKEAVGDLGCLVRQLSLDQFENESRRMHPNNEQSYQSRRALNRQRSPQGLHKKVISLLLRPRNWNAPADRTFFLDSYEVGELCYAAEQIFMQEPTVLQLKAPVKVFGDLHGQFGDLMRLFDEYGYPSTAGDITYIDYLFLGDYVDRGQHSLETITLLLALKIEYPENIHLIRGNHEAADINALFGFRLECIERMGESDGIWAWTRFNQLFNYLPLAAMIEKKIICMHGGIGRSINSVEQIEKIERPITMDVGSIILMDLLWSDPTENDSVEGLRPNARGPGLVTFGPDRVTEFCKRNKLQLIIRAHECVMDGFERFAHGQLITLFSATNYCGTANNAGAILVVGRGLVIVPKLIHPLPPPINSPESSPERAMDATWMQELNIQRPPTPTRGRPHSASDRNSLAYI
ncbi:serine/threonine-protein phosphatase BSL1 homolog isoform X3 [Brachypodium distachyon]|uniref:serine/threonine-protein phosphatase BSL1 homolog isoform X3 n=1 Tax=Brachypodium distachyon TaxID=15368 RepID=UPI00052FEEB4|nr:serine/threonine-protein phosphatase BSL1 homolog isoform X3 [Brachypodium distachyon]|eukprot:XP_010231727.1 serine/threonine-protein phosphatase BSL1 homolog isoform X3 [Brachypodium distachyon]